ncbi:putative G-patch domain-containing protein [Helianthus annuus]|nr:putative G-patch domain-containing protein [Helianthus annuus]KAJ0619314.1 putative G-patch domain-containing protein [Helianthus annuus]KAJ0940592.1 putative G-patch domain-containing protein [Helianthus annuus]
MKPSLNPSQNKPFFTAFDPPQTQTKPTCIIPPLANVLWTPQNNTNHTDPPEEDQNISYGLNLRAKKDSCGSGRTRNVDRFKSDSRIERILLKKLKRDLDSLPEDGGMDEFEDMPVESFAPALLKGYGWYEGRGVGKNPKDDVKVFEIKRKRGRGGIGFVNIMPPVFVGKDRK